MVAILSYLVEHKLMLSDVPSELRVPGDFNDNATLSPQVPCVLPTTG